MRLIALLAPWVVCGVLGYLINRKSFRNGGYRWTNWDRMLTILLCLLFSPLTLLVFCLIYVGDNKEAKW